MNQQIKERRQLEVYISRIVLFVGLSEQAILIFECSYLATLHYFEFIAILVIIMVIVAYFLKQVHNMQRLLKFEEDCKNCKTSSLCEICHACQNDSNHYSILEICLTSQEIQLVNKLQCVFVLKIILSLLYQAYTVSIVKQSMSLCALLQATGLCVLFVNSVFCILLGVFWRKFSQEWKRKQNECLHQSPDKFQEIVQQPDPIIETGQQKIQPQQELEDKGSLNVSINDYISPGLHQLKSSLTPSPGKYRSGKILDFLEKKLSHAKLSQKEIGRSVYSKEFSKKYTTEQAVQISVDFGDCFEDQSNRQKIEREIHNHNFLQQTKFLS